MIVPRVLGASSRRPRVVLDSDILWSPTKRDFILGAAEQHAFIPFWSSGTLGEVTHAEVRRRRTAGASDEIARAGADRLVRAMTAAFPDAKARFDRDMPRTVVRTTNGDVAIDPETLPDRDDAHVIATAWDVSSDAIVTNDRRGFPSNALPPHTRVFTDSSFVEWLARFRSEAALESVMMVSGHTRFTPEALLTKFDRDFGWSVAAELLRERVDGQRSPGSRSIGRSPGDRSRARPNLTRARRPDDRRRPAGDRGTER